MSHIYVLDLQIADSVGFYVHTFRHEIEQVAKFRSINKTFVNSLFALRTTIAELASRSP